MTHKELKKQLRELEKWEKAHPFLAWCRNKYYAIERFILDYKHYPVRIKNFFQRVFRGYDDRIYWDLGNHFAEYMLPKIKYFKKMEKNGYPAGLSEKEWDDIIDKIIWSLERVVNDDVVSYKNCRLRPKKTWMPRIKKQQEGLKLLGEYLTSLWD